MAKKRKNPTPRLPAPPTFPGSDPDKITSRQVMVLARICKTPTAGAQITDVVLAMRSDYGYTMNNRDAWAVLKRLATIGLINRNAPERSWGNAFYTPTPAAFDALDRWRELHTKIIEQTTKAQRVSASRRRPKPAKK